MTDTQAKRVVVYLQSQQNLNLLPQCYDHLTAINVSSIHFGNNPDGSPYIHLNDNDPNDPIFDQLWKDMASAQDGGVKVMLMVGGAGGAYTELFNNYDTFYPLLVKTIQNYNINGIDLDVEERVTLDNIQKLISDLRRDFPSNFFITSAPVASSLISGNDPFAGINWADVKDQIDWFNVQFYSGFGTLSNTSDYEAIINAGYPSSQILGGSLTNPNDGSGYVPISILCETLGALSTQYGTSFGGAMGWEYFNANNISDQEDPVGWCKAMNSAVNG